MFTTALITNTIGQLYFFLYPFTTNLVSSHIINYLPVFMKRNLIVFSLVLFASCHTSNGTGAKSDTTFVPSVPDSIAAAPVGQQPVNYSDHTDEEVNARFPWMRDTILSYISLSINELVKDYVKDSSIVFIYDRFENTDTAGYVMVQLGADINNGDGVIFSTAQWLNIDTLTRQIYEYDIAADTIRHWVRP